MKPINVTIYTTEFCPYCVRAKSLLKSKGVPFQEFDVNSDPELRQDMMRKSGRRTVPQIWIGDKHIGGCDELQALERNHKLDKLLFSEA
jgi:glutaredoxin 3